jgi:uncharacterized protein YaiI (UPF0178 family)
VLTVYVDAYACPVKDETYRVARRYGLRVVVAANAPMRVPNGPLFELNVLRGFGEVDDWIAANAGPGDVVITADVPLAARCVEKAARVLDPKGREFTESDVGSALAMRDLLTELRQTGEATGGPAPMTARDRSRFLSKLDETLNALLRAHPKS